MTLRFMALVRVSSREQEMEGFSLPVQEENIRRAAAKVGITVTEVVKITESASTAQARVLYHEAIVRLKAEGRAGRLDGIFFDRVDRATRNYIDLGVLEELVKVHGLRVRFVTPDIEASTMHGSAMLGMFAVFAKYTTDSKVKEIRDSLKKRVQEGLFVGHAPFGYENYPHNGRSLIRIHSENGKKLRTIFDIYATGNHTIRSLRAALFEAGITYSAKQPRFTPSYLHKMLQSRAYIGEVPSGGKWHPGAHEPLVERAIFERVQALLGNKTYKKHLLTYSHKVVRCGACGLFIVGEPKVKRTRSGEEKSYVYYRCTANTSEGHPRVRLTEDEMDVQVRKVFELLRVKDEDVRVWIVAALTDLCSTNEERDRATRRELKAQISRVGEKKNQLLRMRLEERVSPEQYDTMHAELRAQESGLLRQIEAAGREQSENADLVADTFELSQRLAEKWDAANVPERRQLLQIVALNWVLEGRTLLPSLRPPFDLLADGLLAAVAEDGRGDEVRNSVGVGIAGRRHPQAEI